jgi:hypothetical protein
MKREWSKRLSKNSCQKKKWSENKVVKTRVVKTKWSTRGRIWHLAELGGRAAVEGDGLGILPQAYLAEEMGRERAR